MKFWLKILSVVIITFCFGINVLSGENTFEGRTENRTEYFASTRLDGEFTLSDLARTYDFVGGAFILSASIDLPGDTGIEKEKRGGLSKLLSCHDSILKSHHIICQEKFREYLFTKHVHGFYIYRIGRLVI